MNKQELASRIWESANNMRSKIEANEYKDYILGFIFYKYLSENELSYMAHEGALPEELPELLTEEDVETCESVRKNIGYFISYENLYSSWLKKGKDFAIDDVYDALNAFDRLVHEDYRGIFEDIFKTLHTGLEKLGDTAKKQSKSVLDLLNLIKDVPVDGQQGYDMLGYIYEYLLEKFAANAGKKAGEFYTPHEVSLLMANIVANHLVGRDEIRIYDPTSGSGSLLINIGKAVAKQNDNKDFIKYYAQEYKQNTYNLTRMNLLMRGIKPYNITTRNGDTLDDDWPYFDPSDPDGTYDPLFVDAVVSNPPYSQPWEPENMESDARFKDYGIAPKKKADYAFLLHDLYHTRPDGIMTIVLPHGVLFRGGSEGVIRQNLIENGNIDAIIGLPANIFFGTGIPTIIMVLKKQRDDSNVLIIDASNDFKKDGKQNKLRACDIKRIADTVAKREEIDKYSKLATLEEIRENDYNLNIPRYVDSSKEPETWDIYASMFGGIPKNELFALNSYWNVFPNLYSNLFEEVTDTNIRLAVDDVDTTVRSHPEVQKFKDFYAKRFVGFDVFLRDELVENSQVVNVAKEEDIIGADIFRRMKDVPLINKYDAYEQFANKWEFIARDLETMQIDGFEIVKKVDPHMVTKKVKGTNQEVQATKEGERWVGRIIPFDLIYHTLFADEYATLEKDTQKLEEAASRKVEIFTSLTDEEKLELSDVLNNAGDNFKSGEIKKLAKTLEREKPSVGYDEDSIEARVIEFKKCLELESVLKKKIKAQTIALEDKSKETIENLDDATARKLLEKKWIDSLLTELSRLSDDVVNDLVDSIIDLQKKYSETLGDIDRQIEETEKDLVKMIDQLVGNEEDMAGLAELKRLLGGE